MLFPSIAAVASELQDINATELTTADADEGIEVRLQVRDDGTWAVHGGDPSYDTDHTGHWGASSIPGNGERFDARAVARELIEQAQESRAASE